MSRELDSLRRLTVSLILNTQGQVNRLKTIKRQMYGRAEVKLLRARLIPLTVAPILLQQE